MAYIQENNPVKITSCGRRRSTAAGNSPFNKNGKPNDKEKKKEKPYNWDPTLRRLDKDQVGNSGIYIT
jgi:hypothetical protein